MARFVVDIESDGPCPGLYSMVSFGVVDIDNHENTFYGKTAPLVHTKYNIEALAISGFSREEHEDFPTATYTMLAFNNWLLANYKDERKIMWSDNIAFDWQWINYYCHKYLSDNPFGYSGRRIGDYYAGRKNNIKDHSSWKRLRKTKHTHHPVDDALGNAQALIQIERS